MYICVCFIRNYSNNSTWCQNRGCSYISSTRRIYRSNPAVSCISPNILNKVELVLLILQRREEDHIQASSEQFPDRNFILHGSKALQLPVQGPREGSQCFPWQTVHSTRQKLHSTRQRSSSRLPCVFPCMLQ